MSVVADLIGTAAGSAVWGAVARWNLTLGLAFVAIEMCARWTSLSIFVRAAFPALRYASSEGTVASTTQAFTWRMRRGPAGARSWLEFGALLLGVASLFARVGFDSAAQPLSARVLGALALAMAFAATRAETLGPRD